MQQRNSSIPSLIRFSRPWTLLAGVLFFVLGAGIARYLGQPFFWSRFWLGLGMTLLLLESSYLLKAYFDLVDAENPLLKTQKDLRPEDPDSLQRIPRQGLLILSLATLTAGAVLTVLQLSSGAIILPTLIILGLSVLLAFFYAVPPLRLVNTGFGDLSEALLLAGLIPAFSFLLQNGELHRFLLIFALPFSGLYLAVRIADSLKSYARDLKLARKTFLITVGWQRAMLIHNLIIPAFYLLIVLASLFGLPWSLTWPVLLTIPLGGFQVWQMLQIAAGAKPQWRVLTFTSAALLGLSVYLVALALWTV